MKHHHNSSSNSNHPSSEIQHIAAPEIDHKLINKTIGKNATERDKALLTLSISALGLGLLQGNTWINGHYHLYKPGMIAFTLCIISVLYSLRRTDSALRAQATCDDSMANLHDRYNTFFNDLAFFSFIAGVILFVLCIF